MKIHREELNINGFTKLGKVISETDLPIFLKKLYELSQQQIEKYGKHQLRFVAFMSVVQVLTVVMMLLAFWVISHVVE